MLRPAQTGVLRDQSNRIAASQFQHLVIGAQIAKLELHLPVLACAEEFAQAP